MNITVLGAGAWGTALAIRWASAGDIMHPTHCATLWSHSAAQIKSLQQHRTNQRYLPDITLPKSIQFTCDFKSAVAHADIVFIATPTAALKELLVALQGDDFAKPIVWLCKGLDQITGELPHEIAKQVLKSTSVYGVLSGPSFAMEVAAGLPCALTLALTDITTARYLTTALSTSHLRLYALDDLLGVELGGVIKNVIAIAAGISDGLYLGDNARAALITRGAKEMQRLGIALGGTAETFYGLSGIGDLLLTCTGGRSRNRTVGLELARGKELATILRDLGHVAEGVRTASWLVERAKKAHIELPICESVAAVLEGTLTPQEATQRLLARTLRDESDITT